MAAPIASQILGEVLPYLEVSKYEDVESKNAIIVPSFIGLSKQEAKEILESKGLQFEFNESESISENPTVVKQIPIEGVKIEEGTKIILYIE